MVRNRRASCSVLSGSSCNAACIVAPSKKIAATSARSGPRCADSSSTKPSYHRSAIARSRGSWVALVTSAMSA